MVTTTHLSMQRGSRTVLSDVSVTLQAGEFVAICGPNGAGKSTLLNLLAGDLQPSEGMVQWWDRKLTPGLMPWMAQRRAVVRQRMTYSFSTPVREVVALGRYPHKRSANDAPACAEAMALAEVEHLADRDILQLSGGEQQRVAFARALCQLHGVPSGALLLDEPTSALDLRHQGQLMRTCRELRQHVVVAVIHDLNLAAAFADRVLMMANGQLLRDGAPSEVLTPETVSSIYRTKVLSLNHTRPIFVHAP